MGLRLPYSGNSAGASESFFMPGKKRVAGTKFQQVHVYHLLMNLSRLYTEFSMGIPKALLEVNQSAHGGFEHLCSEAMKVYDELENWKSSLYGSSG